MECGMKELVFEFYYTEQIHHRGRLSAQEMRDYAASAHAVQADLWEEFPADEPASDFVERVAAWWADNNGIADVLPEGVWTALAEETVDPCIMIVED